MGGASRRMGHDKAQQDWNGRSAVDRVFDLAFEAGVEVALAVGRDIPGRTSVVDGGGGPVGGVVLAARYLHEAGCARALILAVDAPTLTAQDLTPLLRSPTGAAFQGQHLPMVLPIAAIPMDAEAGWPMGRLAERAGLARPPCDPVTLPRVRRANTPDERAALLAALVPRQGAHSGETD